MGVSVNDIEMLDGKFTIPTSNDKYTLSEDYEMIFNDPEFRVLGFIKNRMFIYTYNYVSKYTLEGKFLSRLYIEVEHGTFNDNVPFMYLFKDNILYKVSENLELEWELETDDYIKNITMDSSGNVYVIFEHARNIYKYNSNGELILYLYFNENISKTCRLYKTYISPGRTFLYVAGGLFYDNKCDQFIVKYNTHTGIMMDFSIVNTLYNVSVDANECAINDLYVNGDYIFIKGYNDIEKVNKKMQLSWKHMLAYNDISETFNRLESIEYDNSSYQDYIYFCEDLYDTNGYAYGKISINGNLLWKYTCPESDMETGFNISVNDDYIYAWNKESIRSLIPSVLSVNNNSLLFETREGNLIKLLEYNKEIYNSEYFFGKRLYSDELLNDIPDNIYIPLLYHIGNKYGPILNEEGRKILIGYENKITITDDNYAYRRLIADLIDDANYIKSRLISKSKKRIVTKNGSFIKTKEPYKVENSYDVLCTKKGREVLSTLDNQELLRKAGKPYVYYGLLADYFKFYKALLTKKEKKPVLTKKDKFYICKKTIGVYKYYFRRLKDVNLLVEYIMQNNVLSTVYPNYVEKLKHHTFKALDDVQKSTCPSYYDLKTVKVNKYTYDAETYYINENYVSMFLAKNLPFIKKKEYEPLDIRSMADMVIDETITPFIMFINGRAIKWSDITIVRDWHESFIIIENMIDETVYSDRVDCIIYPCVIHYGEDANIDETNNTGLYFSEDGLFTTNIDKIAMRIEVLDDNIISSTQRITDDKKYIEMDLEKGKIANEYNIFVFDEGLFDSDNRYYLYNTGYNIFGYNKETEGAVFRTFYYIKGLDSKNTLLKLPNTEAVKQDSIDYVSGKSSQKYLSTLNYKFDFHFSRHKTYDRNIAEALDYISSFDISLLMNYYKKQSNIETLTLTGKEVNDRASNGYLTIAKQSRSYSEDHIIVYKNGILYDEYQNIQSKYKCFMIPISGFLDDDILEVVHFRNVNNKIHKITILEDEPITIASYFRHDNFLLFANVSAGTYPQESENKIDVDFDYINYYNGAVYKNSNIKFSDSYYYGKTLDITSKRQFHHQHFSATTSNKIFMLSSEFRCAHNENQYLIMINGRKINKDQWDLQLNTHNIKIITDQPINYLDIFYLPDPCVEICIDQYVTNFGLGDIDIPDSEDFDLPFDKDVFSVFVGGEKIPLSNIENIDKNSFRIIDKSNIVNDLCICKYIQSDIIMKELFSYQELWSNGTKTLDKNTYQKIFEML